MFIAPPLQDSVVALVYVYLHATVLLFQARRRSERATVPSPPRASAILLRASAILPRASAIPAAASVQPCCPQRASAGNGRPLLFSARPPGYGWHQHGGRG